MAENVQGDQMREGQEDQMMGDQEDRMMDGHRDGEDLHIMENHHTTDRRLHTTDTHLYHPITENHHAIDRASLANLTSQESHQSNQSMAYQANDLILLTSHGHRTHQEPHRDIPTIST